MNMFNTTEMKKQAQNIGEETRKLVHSTFVEPVTNLAHEAREAVGGGVRHAQDFVSDHATAVRETLGSAVGRTRDTFVHERERISGWVRAHPLSTVALAVIAGCIYGTFRTSRR